MPTFPVTWLRPLSESALKSHLPLLALLACAATTQWPAGKQEVCAVVAPSAGSRIVPKLRCKDDNESTAPPLS